MPPVIVDTEKVHEFRTAHAFSYWLSQNHATERKIWIKIHKVGSALESITAKAAIDVALCWGWIDSIRKAYDINSFLQRYTPRCRTSTWSLINVNNVARLVAEGRMTAHGLRPVDAARADGRWQRAYSSRKKISLPNVLREQ